MNFFYCLLYIKLCLYMINCVSKEIRDLLKGEIEHFKVIRPINTNLALKIQSISDMQAGTIQSKDFLLTLKAKYNLPTEAVDKFQGITFASSLRFQSFCLYLNDTNLDLKEYVGAARNFNNNVEFAFINVNTNATACRRPGIKEEDCKNLKYSPQDLLDIKLSMQATAFEFLEFKVSIMDNAGTFFDYNEKTLKFLE